MNWGATLTRTTSEVSGPMDNDTARSAAAGFFILGICWAAVLAFTDPSMPVLVALGVASVGLLALTVFARDDDDDPPTADDLGGDGRD